MALVDRDDVERDAELTEARVPDEPGFGGPVEPPLLLVVDHLEGAAEPGSGLRLHLAEHQPPPAADDEVQP